MESRAPSAASGVATRRIGILGFDQVAALDLAGVLDAFYIASRLAGASTVSYQTVIVGLSDRPFVAESGLRMIPEAVLSDSMAFDTIIVPGGSGIRSPEVSKEVGSWLGSQGARTRRFVSVCTGVYGLAASGLLDGRRATTHWRHAAHAARRFPHITFETDAIFIKDGPCYSSAGMTAGIDLALALIEEDLGPAIALATARQMVVYMKRSGGQLQYSEPLQSQTRAGDRFADLIARMVGDLGADWSVEAMSERTGLSSRQFSRRFKVAFTASPAAFLEALRLDEARVRLATGQDVVARIAHAVGFRSDDAFRRAFERRFGVTPTAYRSRFSARANARCQGDSHDAALRS